MTGTKEFQELRNHFEKSIKASSYIGSVRLDREPKDSRPGVFYQDGAVNDMFHYFMLGYQLAKCNAMLEQA